MLGVGVLLVAVVTGVVAGVLIGSVGVGGIVIVPILIQYEAVDVQMAIASAMASYMAAGVVGMLMYARESSIEWKTTAGLLLGAAPAAFAGSFMLKFFSDMAVKLVLYVLMLGSSVLALARTMRGMAADREDKAEAASATIAAPTVASTNGIQPVEDETDPVKVIIETEAQSVKFDLEAGDSIQSAPTLAPTEKADVHSDDSAKPVGLSLGVPGTCCRLVVGGITGFGSAVTGTSGPVVSLPIFLLLRWPITTSLGSAQAVQVPIAAASTLSYLILRPGVIEWPLAGAVAIGLAPFVAVGALIAHRVPKATLKLTVAVVLVVSSVVLIGKLVIETLIDDGGGDISDSDSL